MFEDWEWLLVDRLTDHILPFRTEEVQRWLAINLPYRLDRSVGVVNYIDKILAREEGHRRIDYTMGLGVIHDLMRARFPVIDPHTVLYFARPSRTSTIKCQRLRMVLWCPIGTMIGLKNPLPFCGYCGVTHSRGHSVTRPMAATSRLLAGDFSKTVTAIPTARHCSTGGKRSRHRWVPILATMAD